MQSLYSLPRFSHPRLTLWLVLIALSMTGCRSSAGWVMNASGKHYYCRGNYALARYEFSRATQFDPCHPTYRHNLAMAMKQTGDVSGAEEELRANLTVNPMHQASYHSLAVLLNESGRQPEAAELLQSWVDTQPYVPEAHVEMAWMDRQTGNLAGAESHLKQALEIRRNHPVALSNLGQLYQDQGMDRQAIAMYEDSLRSKWNQPQVQNRLASLTAGERRSGQRAGISSPIGYSRLSRTRHSDRVLTAYALPTYGSPYEGNTLAGLGGESTMTTAYAPQDMMVSAPSVGAPGQPVMTAGAMPVPDPVSATGAQPQSQVVLLPPQFGTTGQPQMPVPPQTPWVPAGSAPPSLQGPTLSFSADDGAYAPPTPVAPPAAPLTGLHPDPAHVEGVDTVELPEINPF